MLHRGKGEEQWRARDLGVGFEKASVHKPVGTFIGDEGGDEGFDAKKRIC